MNTQDKTFSNYLRLSYIQQNSQQKHFVLDCLPGEGLILFPNNYTFRGQRGMARWFPLRIDKVGHSLNYSCSLSQKWLPGARTESSESLLSTLATKWSFISSASHFLNNKDMMNSDLAPTSSIFTIPIQIHKRSEDSNHLGKK